eukprot:Cvel_20756.t1-p1 / transcript=Cvel_20756.t1 / gene=Cvel_20756 / organism=Chromera_velia_CCMP2878 / gene_product=hypothetical protein / transcript_product=hypothetical protein / location=Cvel_scaffold1892:3582-8323(-) / protein_length=281 / sequence_SO=supercontig / SO=protein_coding / is_pseudo=false
MCPPFLFLFPVSELAFAHPHGGGPEERPEGSSLSLASQQKSVGGHGELSVDPVWALIQLHLDEILEKTQSAKPTNDHAPPLETPIAPREVDRDASPSQGRCEGIGETFALQNMGPKDDVCPYVFATLRQEPLAIAGAPLDSHMNPADPRGSLDRSPVGRKVAESSLSAAQELLPAAPQTSSVLMDERDGHPSKGSQIPPTVSSKMKNRLAHMYNGNSSGERRESDLEKVTRKIEQVEATMGGSTVQAKVGIYGGRSQAFLESVLPELLKEKNQLAGASSSA